MDRLPLYPCDRAARPEADPTAVSPRVLVAMIRCPRGGALARMDATDLGGGSGFN